MRTFKTKSEKIANPSKTFARYAVLISFGVIAAMLIIAAVVMFISIDGDDVSKVPDVQGKTLVEAMTELQNKGIYTRIKEEHTQSNADKGRVVDQSKKPGTTVRVNSKVVLTISKGKIIDILERYIERDIESVTNEIQNYYEDIIMLTPIERSNSKPYGTILDQKPLPGSPITENTRLQFIISRGQKGEIVTIPDFKGLNHKQAIDAVIKSRLTFAFKIAEPARGQAKGVVITQSPKAETKQPRYTTVVLSISKPAAGNTGEIFGIFNYNFEIFPVSTNIKVTQTTPSGSVSDYFIMKHKGGHISIPHFELPGTVFTVYQDDIEVFSKTVTE